MREKENTTEIFKNAPVPKAVISNVIPSIISMMMVLIYNLADTFFIGQTKDPIMVASVSIATPVFVIFMAVGMLFGIGGTSLISRMLGQGNTERAKNISSFCFWTGLIIGIISMIGIWIGVKPLCKIVGAITEDTFKYASQYLSIIAIGIPFLITGNMFSHIIRSEGKATKAMKGMIIGNITNIILDPIFILMLDWKVAGAAAATVVGNIVSLLFYLSHLLSSNSILSIKPSDYCAKTGIAQGVLSIGIPASLNSIMMSVSNIYINKLMGTHGDIAVAGLGVAMKVNMIVVMLLIGLGTGIQPLLGYCFGSGNKKRFSSVIRFSLLLAICLSFIMTIICYAGAGPMVKSFLDDQSAYEYGMSFARIYIYSGPILGIMFVCVNAIQAMGAAIPSFILSLSRQGLVYFPMLTIIRYVADTPQNLAMAQPITDYISTLMAGIMFIFTFKSYFRENIPDENDWYKYQSTFNRKGTYENYVKNNFR